MPDSPAVFPFINREWALAQSALGVQPFAIIRQSANDANKDYMYNHGLGPDWLRGINIDVAGFNFGDSDLIDWDGAVNLFQYAEYATQHGGSLDLVHDWQLATDTINGIIDATHVLPEHVWNYYRHLLDHAQETGNASMFAPHLQQIQTDKPGGGSFWPYVIAGLMGIGLIAYIAHE